ncbi:hypothetical protein EYF80_061374 [Liparis tanakae]|uniref:Uncharacterized protein n=1 Tax=Liparis tanakae TaxID=230148 RepID=A0A4Z2EIA8_9TELE|nr:hypothetical protein EYF80_061374 [Liparis tanakae]
MSEVELFLHGSSCPTDPEGSTGAPPPSEAGCGAAEESEESEESVQRSCSQNPPTASGGHVLPREEEHVTGSYRLVRQRRGARVRWFRSG